ncbi:PP2C family protein-serine/threonine phosphatase [Gracilimonas tropica]|uniref:PP2C family protein-serine/threonine phosphatase n=1 Tax=Gracilimonas tropica TaxID=454600 RepID=UPI000381C4F8|nr:PP2C family protein-serine/threonine phosphatase [Gracilimonas tropica]
MRPHIEFYASGPIQNSKEATEEYIHEIAPSLGFSTDSLALLTMRKQHQEYTKTLRDTMAEEVRLAELNKYDLHIQSWQVILGIPGRSDEMLASSDQFFNNEGRLMLHLSNDGKIIRVKANPEFTNPTFLQGDSLLAIADQLVDSVLGYDLNRYSFMEQAFDDTSLNYAENQGMVPATVQNQNSSDLELFWKRKPGVSGTPQELRLTLKPVVREASVDGILRTEFGFSIDSFAAVDEFESVDWSSSNSDGAEQDLTFSYLLFGSLFVLAAFIFSIGTRNIFKGKVEWRRALFVFVAITLSIYVWRAVFYMYSFNPFLNSAGLFTVFINNLLFSVVVGLYASLAYISWEALARSQHQRQLSVVDALWQRYFFVSETGSGLVHGVAFGGILIGIMSSLVYLTGTFLVQADSQFGFSEPTIPYRLLTINLSAATTTMLVGIAQIAFVYSILKHWLKKEWQAGLMAIILSGIFITVLGRLIGTSGTLYEDLILYLGLATVLIYAMMEFGVLTVCTAWWTFSVFFMVQPYWQSQAIEVAYVGWAQFVLMSLPLIYGFISYKYGIPVSEVGEYIPEYEERIAQHLRVEKEIEIARESQFKLMPLQPPKADGIDVYGFFMPSFEVGGDYFDYLLSEDENENPVALTMSVVDVSGKAMQAAMPAVFTSGLLLSRMKHDCPDEVLSEISEPIFYRTDKRTFITCALARYDLRTQQMAIANAGHCRPILKRNGIAEYIHTPKPSFPLGMKKDVKYEREVIAMKKGDFFLLYSDGLPEAVNPKGERFGFEKVPRLIESIDTENLSAQEIAQEIKRTVQKFSNYQLADDTTIICLKI